MAHRHSVLTRGATAAMEGVQWLNNQTINTILPLSSREEIYKAHIYHKTGAKHFSTIPATFSKNYYDHNNIALLAELSPNLGDDSNDDDDEGCGPLDGLYSNKLHIAAVFIILLASLIGTLIPILGKRFPALRVHKFVYVVGKNVGTGVMMAVGMIHMINEAVHEFDASCAPQQFQDAYEA
uniref:Zinc transporter 3 n=1 Tax=Lygus hesperus TaxID=30085 RepID=A0A0A9VV82_LYGHE